MTYATGVKDAAHVMALGLLSGRDTGNVLWHPRMKRQDIKEYRRQLDFEESVLIIKETKI